MLTEQVEITAVGGKVYGAVTRTIDLLVAVIGLALLALPLAILALACRYSTGGSGLFKQARLGKNGQVFQLLKLRTLRTDVHFHPASREAASFATPLGRLLRELKVDEIPQLWNVMTGDMSLVGPRPIIPDEYTDRSHYERLMVHPGLTGLWQLSEARWRPFDDNPEYDRFYLTHRSLRLDLWLIWRTVLLVFARKETRLETATALFGRGRGVRWADTVLRPSVHWAARAISISIAFGVAILSALAAYAG